MASIRFLGAAQEVTGSCHLLSSAAVGKVLLDCGMHQGGDAVDRLQEERFAFKPAEIDAVILSHAHIDHSGLLPKLVCEGFRGPIYCTRATADLLEVMLNDAAGLYERDLERENLRRARRGAPEPERRDQITLIGEVLNSWTLSASQDLAAHPPFTTASTASYAEPCHLCQWV